MRQEVFRMRSRTLITAIFITTFVAAGCAGNQAAATVAPVTAAPATVAPATAAPTEAATVAPTAATTASAATVEAKSVGSVGTVLVAGSNGMTVYVFAMDVEDSGTSNCTGGCLDTWPALTVPAGSTPVAGSGVTGTLGTITRSDTGALQVTYNGLPLYFFSNDKAPGDANGVYTNWDIVHP
jgi:predicted lipoprotein with Yx(FWY)xxD motif